MKTSSVAFVVSLFVLTGCVTIRRADNTTSVSETVLVTYHVKPGKEAEFEKLLWYLQTRMSLLRKQGMEIKQSAWRFLYGLSHLTILLMM